MLNGMHMELTYSVVYFEVQPCPSLQVHTNLNMNNEYSIKSSVYVHLTSHSGTATISSKFTAIRVSESEEFLCS